MIYQYWRNPDGLALNDDQLRALRKQFAVQHVMLGQIDPPPAMLPLKPAQGVEVSSALARVSAPQITNADSSQAASGVSDNLVGNLSSKLDLTADASRTSHWWLGDAEQNTAWSQPSLPMWSVLQQAMGSLANMLSNQAVASAAETGAVAPVTVMVTGVDALRQYQQLTSQFLRSNAISGVQLLGITAHGVRLRLTVAGGAATLLQIMQNSPTALPDMSLQTNVVAAAGGVAHAPRGSSAAMEHTVFSSAAADGQLGCGADVCLQWR